MRRPLLYGSLVVVATTLLVSTGGFSSITADRGVDVGVAPDDAAFVGVDDKSSVTGTVDGEPITLFDLSDNAPNDITADASILSDAPVALESVSFDDGITARCINATGSDATDIDVEITASGPGMSAELIRSVTVQCVTSDDTPNETSSETESRSSVAIGATARQA